MEAGQGDGDASRTQHVQLTLSSTCAQGDAPTGDTATWEGPWGWEPLPPH